jgi:hypothetical protein
MGDLQIKMFIVSAVLATTIPNIKNPAPIYAHQPNSVIFWKVPTKLT